MDLMNNETIGHRFRLGQLIATWEFLHRRKLPLEELAEATDISRQTLSKLLDPRGDYATSSRHIEALCRFFRVTPNDLIEFDPPIEQAVEKDS